MVASARERFSHMERLEPLRFYGAWDGATWRRSSPASLPREAAP